MKLIFFYYNKVIAFMKIKRAIFFRKLNETAYL